MAELDIWARLAIWLGPTLVILVVILLLLWRDRRKADRRER